MSCGKDSQRVPVRHRPHVQRHPGRGELDPPRRPALGDPRLAVPRRPARRRRAGRPAAHRRHRRLVRRRPELGPRPLARTRSWPARPPTRPTRRWCRGRRRTGTPLHLVAAAPMYPWTDLADALVQNGRAADGLNGGPADGDHHEPDRRRQADATSTACSPTAAATAQYSAPGRRPDRRPAPPGSPASTRASRTAPTPRRQPRSPGRRRVPVPVRDAGAHRQRTRCRSSSSRGRPTRCSPASRRSTWSTASRPSTPAGRSPCSSATSATRTPTTRTTSGSRRTTRATPGSQSVMAAATARRTRRVTVTTTACLPGQTHVTYNGAQLLGADQRRRGAPHQRRGADHGEQQRAHRRGHQHRPDRQQRLPHHGGVAERPQPGRRTPCRCPAARWSGAPTVNVDVAVTGTERRGGRAAVGGRRRRATRR